MLQNIKTAFDIIRGYLKGNPVEYAQLRLKAAKNLFATVAVLYFFVFLSTIGGFHTDIMSILHFYIFPIFVFSFFALIYMLIAVNYIVGSKNPILLQIFFLLILSILFFGILSIHI